MTANAAPSGSLGLTADALARMLDHSVLKPEASEADVRDGAALVERLRIGFYCVQPAYVPFAVSLLRGVDARVAAVIGFPHGCERTPVKVAAAQLLGEASAGSDIHAADLSDLLGRYGISLIAERIEDGHHGFQRVAQVDPVCGAGRS